MATGGDNIIKYIYTGADGERVPDDVTKVFVINVKVVRAGAFYEHPNIVEVVCDDKVEKIERDAFQDCPSLRRLVMPGVKIVEYSAFYYCTALTDVECGKLEIIGEWAFADCRSLRSINLPSAKIVECCAFFNCKSLADVKFSRKSETIHHIVFANCSSLERITIPLKHGLITEDSTFQACKSLKHVDLIEGELHETIAALQLEEMEK